MYLTQLTYNQNWPKFSHKYRVVGGNKREVKQKDVQHKNAAVQVSLLRTTTKKKKEKKK